MSVEIGSGSTSPTGNAGAEPLTVLVIDDDHAVRSGLTELLAAEGFAVATAADGLDALAQLRGGLRPCAILLDLMMPRMDGWDFRQEQINDPRLKELPVVVITATGFSEASVKRQFGDIAFVPKPPAVKQLLDAIRRHCRVQIT